MTLHEAYHLGGEQLKTAGIEEADLDAWYLLEHVTGIDRTGYFLNCRERLSKEQEEAYREALQKRAAHIPLQQITGVQEFMGLKFRVNEHVLIPRQDTEVLVEEVCKVQRPGMHVLDMCTGSGCILISLLKYSEAEGNMRTGSGQPVTGVGVDISKEALHVAEQNAKALGVAATWLHSNLFERVTGRYDIIVSNPPYIPTSVIHSLAEEVKLHEPLMALDGKEDGLWFYREIVRKGPEYLKRGGRLFFEIGYDQGEAVRSLMEEAGFTEVTVKKDLAGLDRVVSGAYNLEE